MSIASLTFSLFALVLVIDCSRLDVHVDRELDQWQLCETQTCSTMDAQVGSPAGPLRLPVHRGFLCRAPIWHHSTGSGLNVKEKIERFHRILHGGDFSVQPKRPMLFDASKLLCGNKDVKSPEAALSVARQSSLDLTCLRLQFSPSERSVCGCFSGADAIAPRSKVTSLSASIRNACQFFVVEALPRESSIKHYPQPVLGHRMPPAMHTCPEASPSLGGAICTVTWNVGSEHDATGIGMGGLIKDELRSDLARLILRECAGAAMVAVSIQEGADPEVTSYLHEVADSLSEYLPKKLRLRANAFAGASSWRDSVPVKGLKGLNALTAYKIKEGVLMKVETFGRSPRKVVLTDESLLVFQTSTDLRGQGTPLGPPVAVFDVGSELSAKWESFACFTISGFEKNSKKETSATFCDDANPSATAITWVQTISNAVNKRMGTEQQYLANEVGVSANDVVELPFAKGVSVAVMSLATPSKVQMFGVDFNCATKDGECKKDTFATWAKKKARNLTYTTAEKGGAIVRLEFGDKAICFAACHLEAKNRQKRWLQAKLMSDALSKLECDAEIWVGDFNTRPTNSDGSNKCCPWNAVDLYTMRNSADQLRGLTVGGDDMRLMPGLEVGTSVYEEMPILFPPTFPKRLKRESMDQCSSFPEYQNEEDAGDLISASSLARDDMTEEERSEDLLAALIAANAESLRAEKCSAGKSNMCYGGLLTKTNCNSGGCFNTHDEGHCPGYTDRVMYKPGLIEGSGPILSPCNYVANPSFVTADHTPVIASFTVEGIDIYIDVA